MQTCMSSYPNDGLFIFPNMKSERIKALRLQLGLSQKAVADLVGVSKATVSQWENGDYSPSGDNFLALAKVLNVAPSWLSTGKGSKEPSNVEPAAIPAGAMVPILSYVQAGHWCEPNEVRDHEGNVEWVQASVEMGPYGFALRLRGDSMMPFFRDGDLIFVDPEEPAHPGDFVVAKNGSDEAVFKKYRPRGYDDTGKEIFELVPLNEDYPILRSDISTIRIIGVMVEHRSFRKKPVGR